MGSHRQYLDVRQRLRDFVLLPGLSPIGMRRAQPLRQRISFGIDVFDLGVGQRYGRELLQILDQARCPPSTARLKNRRLKNR